MKYTRFEKYAKKRFKSIKHQLSLLGQKNNVNAFHQIRIDIKKIHAINRYFKSNGIQFLSKRISKQLDILFSKAGKIRSLQIELEILKTQLPELKTHEYVSILKNKSEKYLSDFVKKYKNFKIGDKNSFAAPSLTKWEDGTKHSKIKKIMLSNHIITLRNSRKLIFKGQHLLPSVIHDIRINLKEAIYLSKFLPNRNSNQNDKHFILELGIWHDFISIRKTMFKTLANKEFIETSSSQLVSAIQKINRKISNKIEQIKRDGELQKQKLVA